MGKSAIRRLFPDDDDDDDEESAAHDGDEDDERGGKWDVSECKDMVMLRQDLTLHHTSETHLCLQYIIKRQNTKYKHRLQTTYIVYIQCILYI